MPIDTQTGRWLALILASGALVCSGMVTAQDNGDAARAEAAYRSGDYDTAISIWRDRADAGDVQAMFYLGEAYRTGRGVPRDLRTAEGYYAQAAEAGHRESADNYGLLLYESGRRQEALPYLAESAKRGDARAQYVLGLGHYNGDVVSRDWPRAYALISLADASGLPQAGRARAQMDEFIPADERAAGLRLAQEMTRMLPDMADEAPEPVRTASAVPVRSGPVVQPVPPPPKAPPPPRQATASTDAKSEVRRVAVPQSTAVSRPVVQTVPSTAERSEVRPSTASPATAPARVAAAEPAPRPAAPAVRQGPWIIQLGAFSVPANADRMWSRVSSHAALRGTTRVDSKQGKLSTLAAGGFATRGEAQGACSQLKRAGHECFVTR